jgi:flagellar motor switch protein FliG
VLVHLDPHQASDVLSCPSERTRHDALLRIATLDGIQPAALRELDDVLTEVLAGADNRKDRAMVAPASRRRLVPRRLSSR